MSKIINNSTLIDFTNAISNKNIIISLSIIIIVLLIFTSINLLFYREFF